MSENLSAWATAFVEAQAAFPAIPKNKTANIPIKGGQSHYSYNYADLADILSAIQPVLSKHGLAQAQSVEAVEGQVSVTTRIYHRDGHVESFGPVTLKADVGAQAAGSAITYARRYALCAALGIVPDDADDDGAVAQANAARPARSSQRAKETPDASKPCPACGSACAPVAAANETNKLPKFRCTNEQCGGGKDGRPWASWHVDPWKPGGEIETKFGKGSATAEPTAAQPNGNGSLEANPSPAAPSQGSLGGEAEVPASANPSEGDHVERFEFNLSLIEEAIMGGVTVRGVKLTVGSVNAKVNSLAAKLSLPAITETMGTAQHLAQALSERPPALAHAVVEDLGLEELLSGVRS